MKKLKILVLVLVIAVIGSCSTDDTSEPSTVEIVDFQLNFPTKFTLEELQGIDSYVGLIKGSGITLTFDYGWYTSANIYLEEGEYSVTEEVVQGYFKQVLKPIDADENLTRLHIYKLSDAAESPYGFNKLTVYTNNLNSVEQDMIVNVFTNVEIIE